MAFGLAVWHYADRALKRCFVKLQTFALVSLAALVACGGETVAPPIPVPPVQPTVIALEISPWNATITLGREQLFAASKRMSDGSAIPVSASWVSTDPAVATMSASGSAVAVGIGQANIFASVDGLTAMGSISVKRPASTGTSDALIVEEFTMLEIQSEPGQGSYAPQLRVRAAAGRAVTMLLVDFMIPGLGAAPPWNCVAAIPSTASSELNGEVYGDWQFMIGGAGRVSGIQARADLTFVDESGKVATTSVYGAIIPGSMPSTYTGGNLGGACFAGYRPPG